MSASAKSFVVSVVMAAVVFLPGFARAQSPIPGPCQTGVLPHGALSLICVPAAGWNGELVVFAHGYVAFDQPLGFYHLTFGDGLTLPAVAQGLGYAFATTSYRQNGLAILEGVDDIRELVASFMAGYSVPTRVHLAGASEGGLVAMLLAERSPGLFASVFAACGPIGSFQRQLSYFADFRVLFEYFFPGLIPGSPIEIPASVIANWESTYAPAIAAAVSANPDRARELLRVAKAAYDPGNAATVLNTTLSLLSYNVFGTNDAIRKLGGNPFDNRSKWYVGSRNDLRLNLRVRRFMASAAAREAVRAYETTGDLSIPVVTLHTTGDEVIPFWHEPLYLLKVDLFSRGRFIPVPAFRYGHCNFTLTEVVGSFLLAVKQP
jgi:pimeloyl-ACP methyl ester carboxylesterase